MAAGVSRYYTKTSDFMDVHVLGGSLAYPVNTRGPGCPFTTAVAANAVVTVRWFQYHRIWHVGAPHTPARGHHRMEKLRLHLRSHHLLPAWPRPPQSTGKPFDAVPLHLPDMAYDTQVCQPPLGGQRAAISPGALQREVTPAPHCPLSPRPVSQRHHPDRWCHTTRRRCTSECRPQRGPAAPRYTPVADQPA